jgi:hypothetical protein
MEPFTETKDRRKRQEKMTYQPKRGGQRPQTAKDGDVPMKEEGH